MPAHSFIQSLASIGVFPSRAFLPAFVAALLLRFGDSMPLIAQAGLADNVHAPSWFISNTSLVVLGVLSCLECWATKNADVRELLDRFDAAVKPLMTLLTSLGVASVEDGDLVRAIQQAGFSDGLFGLMAAGTVFFLTSGRRSLYDLLTEIDADDSLGIQRLCSWAEDAWAERIEVLNYVTLTEKCEFGSILQEKKAGAPPKDLRRLRSVQRSTRHIYAEPLFLETELDETVLRVVLPPHFVWKSDGLRLVAQVRTRSSLFSFEGQLRDLRSSLSRPCCAIIRMEFFEDDEAPALNSVGAAVHPSQVAGELLRSAFQFLLVVKHKTKSSSNTCDAATIMGEEF